MTTTIRRDSGPVWDGSADERGKVVLDVRDLTTAFGPPSSSVEAVRGVTFQLFQGRTLVLLGESGSGKSVTARSVLRLYGGNAQTRGHVRLGDLDVLKANERELRSVRGRRLALVPQDPSGALDPLRTIGSQVVEVLRRHNMVPSKKEARGRGVDLLRLVGIPDPARVARAYPHQLSGGMRQRAAIAIAVSCQPEVLIADEPTTALDVTVQAQILELFADLQRSMQLAMLLITHDVGVAKELGDHVAVMYAGKIVEHGPLREVLDLPAHPYTAALLESLPSPEIARGALHAIGGRAVQAGETFQGCAFAPRCQQAVLASSETEPGLVRIVPGRSVACHNSIPIVEKARE